MLSVLLWKEYREHRLVWAAVAFVAAASLPFLPFVIARRMAKPARLAKSLTRGDNRPVLDLRPDLRRHAARRRT